MAPDGTDLATSFVAGLIAIPAIRAPVNISVSRTFNYSKTLDETMWSIIGRGAICAPASSDIMASSDNDAPPPSGSETPIPGAPVSDRRSHAFASKPRGIEFLALSGPVCSVKKLEKTSRIVS